MKIFCKTGGGERKSGRERERDTHSKRENERENSERGTQRPRDRCGGGAAAWVARVLAAPGTQGGWQLGQQEI